MVVDGYEYNLVQPYNREAVVSVQTLPRPPKVGFLLLILNRAMRSKIIQCGEAFSELCCKVEGTVHFISTLPPQCSALMSLSPTNAFI